ncbi:MAG: hypothetical protein Q7K98_04350 [Candidatus Omnitrophota bacterium]|nr:hypothetical protein [Candidatus Omnitrophota bacterium]
MKNRNKYFTIVAIAILLKFFLFTFLVNHAPQSRFQSDSVDYLETAQVLVSHGGFAKTNTDGSLSPEFYRTPGYPVFLAFLLGGLKFSLNGVILLQVLLTILTAWITCKAAFLVDPKIVFLSAVIVLYDPPVSIFSLQILAETLFLFVMALFMLSFISYLKNRKFNMITLSALLLAAATYIRPTSYYLGWLIVIFIIYANIRVYPKKTIVHALVFLLIFYSLLGAWQERNYKRFGQKSFCAVVQSSYRYFGLYKSYSRNKDAESKGMAPAAYYAKTTVRSFLYLMTRPGPFKYFKSKILSAIGNALAYPWMVFWLAGFIIGFIKCGRNIYYQFNLLIIAYFIAASIGGVSLLVGERFRVPMIPFIAIISAYGWLGLAKTGLIKE